MLKAVGRMLCDWSLINDLGNLPYISVTSDLCVFTAYLKQIKADPGQRF